MCNTNLRSLEELQILDQVDFYSNSPMNQMQMDARIYNMNSQALYLNAVVHNPRSRFESDIRSPHTHAGMFTIDSHEELKDEESM